MSCGNGKQAEKEYGVYLTLEQWNEVHFIFEKSGYPHDKVVPIYKSIFAQLNKQLDTVNKK